MELKSLKKKYKSSGFAAGCSREVIARGAQQLGWELEKLLQFTLNDGTGTDRTILSGIHAFYEPEELVGKTLLAITNLPSRSMMGIESCGMLLSAIHYEKREEKLNLVMLGDAIPAGAKLY